jgi:gluconokinase
MTALPAANPLRLIVMGVSGSGKSTLGGALAERMGLEMIDGDELHLPESVAKMRAGIALTDDDRWPWLDRIASLLAARSSPPGLVVACSALRRVYRDRIRHRADGVRFVFLDGSFELIRQRMTLRVGHYMQPDLLQSQFNTLERPASDETDVLALTIHRSVGELVDAAVLGLRQRNPSLSHHRETAEQQAPQP